MDSRRLQARWRGAGASGPESIEYERLSMDSFAIKGGVPLEGEVVISGAKNAVLPIMAATLLTPERCVIRRVPDLSDVQFMAKILMSLGAKVKVEPGVITVEARKLKPVGNYNLIRKMRGSVCILGPLLGRRAPGAGLAAGGLCDRAAADRPAFEGAPGFRGGGDD